MKALKWEWARFVDRAEQRPVWLGGVTEIEMGAGAGAGAGEEGRPRSRRAFGFCSHCDGQLLGDLGRTAGGQVWFATCFVLLGEGRGCGQG